jgi:glycosyltransferase involved in cell wall biosynthesis
MSKKIAILLPVYNAEQFLRECLDSVIAQTYADWKLFACNDGSKDSSLEILNEYASKDHRITVLDNPENMGIVATINRLLKNIPENAEFIALLDSDDVCLPDRMMRQINFLENNPDIGGVSSNLEIIDENSATTGFRKYPCSAELVRDALPYSNVLAQPAMMLRKEIIQRAGYYSSEYIGCEDYEFWLRILEFADFANLAEPVIKYRISSGQTKSRHLKATLKNTMKIQREYFQRIGCRIPFKLRLQHIAGYILLLLPSQWILKIFCLITYRQRDKKI